MNVLFISFKLMLKIADFVVIPLPRPKAKPSCRNIIGVEVPWGRGWLYPSQNGNRSNRLLFQG